METPASIEDLFQAARAAKVIRDEAAADACFAWARASRKEISIADAEAADAKASAAEAAFEAAKAAHQAAKNA